MPNPSINSGCCWLLGFFFDFTWLISIPHPSSRISHAVAQHRGGNSAVTKGIWWLSYLRSDQAALGIKRCFSSFFAKQNTCQWQHRHYRSCFYLTRGFGYLVFRCQVKSNRNKLGNFRKVPNTHLLNNPYVQNVYYRAISLIEWF